MNNTLNLLLQLAISTSIYDRDEFVEKVGNFLQEKMNASPDRGEQLGEEVLAILEQLRSELNMNRMTSRIAKPNKELSEQVRDLTAAINRLNETLQKSQN